MTWLTVATTIFDIFWLSSVLLLLWLIWRNSTRHSHKMEATLIEVAMRSAASAHEAVGIMRDLVEVIRTERKSEDV